MAFNVETLKKNKVVFAVVVAVAAAVAVFTGGDVGVAVDAVTNFFSTAPVQ